MTEKIYTEVATKAEQKPNLRTPSLSALSFYTNAATQGKTKSHAPHISL